MTTKSPSELDKARAEVERLRADAEVRDFREGGLKQAVDVLTADRHCRHLLQQQAESRLAAANALLAKLAVVAVRGIPELLCNLILEARAHLAAQPATAPKYALNFCSNCGSRFDCEECAQPGLEHPPLPRSDGHRLVGDEP